MESEFALETRIKVQLKKLVNFGFGIGQLWKYWINLCDCNNTKYLQILIQLQYILPTKLDQIFSFMSSIKKPEWHVRSCSTMFNYQSILFCLFIYINLHLKIVSFDVSQFVHSRLVRCSCLTSRCSLRRSHDVSRMRISFGYKLRESNTNFWLQNLKLLTWPSLAWKDQSRAVMLTWTLKTKLVI